MYTMMRRLRKEHFQSAYKKADKLIQKDSLHVGALFVKSIYFSNVKNPLFNSDSAYFYLKCTRKKYPYISKCLDKKLQKVGIDIERIQSQKSEIEKAKFDYYEILAQKYSDQKNLLQTLSSSPKVNNQHLHAQRYLVAQRLNTYEAHQRFMDKYPDSPYFQQSKKRFEQLYYQSKTKAQNIQDYENFILENPHHSYTPTAQRTLFQKLLNGHSRSTYENILKKKDVLPPDLIQKALSLWWFSEKNKKYFLDQCPQDYLPWFQECYFYSENELFPVWEHKKITLIDRNGYQKNTIKYKNRICFDDTKGDIFISKKKSLLGVCHYSGKKIVPEKFNEIIILNKTLILVKKGNKYGVFHRGGFQIIDNIYDEITLLSDTYIQTRSGNKYGLYLLNGRELLPTKFDHIELVTRDVLRIDWGKFSAITDQKSLIEKDYRTHFKSLFRWKNPSITHQKFIITKPESHVFEVHNLSGQLLRRIYGKKMTETATGWLFSTTEKVYFFDTLGHEKFRLKYQTVISHPELIAVQNHQKWMAYNYQGKPLIDPEYDQVRYLGKAGFLFKKGDIFYFLHANQDFKCLGKHKNVYIRYTNTQSSLWDVPKEITKIYFITENRKGKQGVIRYNGKIVLPNKYNNITFVDNKIIAELNARKGLYNLHGGELLPLRYRGIVYRERGYFATFARQGFGFYHPQKHIDFPPFYRIIPRQYGKWHRYFIVKKDKFGIVGKRNNLIAPFDFDEIKIWTSKIMLGKKGYSWYLFDLEQKKLMPQVFDDYSLLHQSENESTIRVFKNGYYGLISSKKGLMLDIKYADIKNISNRKEPFYRSEIYVEKLKTYHISYLNHEGKTVYETFIPKNVYEKTDCD